MVSRVPKEKKQSELDTVVLYREVMGYDGVSIDPKESASKFYRDLEGTVHIAAMNSFGSFSKIPQTIIALELLSFCTANDILMLSATCR